MLVAVQGHNELVAIDPATLSVTRRTALPGCEQGHGMTLDAVNRLVFITCEGNAVLVTVDLNSWEVSEPIPVGSDPDVLAYDPGAHRLYVAAESGTVLALRDQHLAVVGRTIWLTARMSWPSIRAPTAATTRSRPAQADHPRSWNASPPVRDQLAGCEAHHDDGEPTVLFLCVHNAGRSQMALGFFRHLVGDGAVAWSGGSEPGYEINGRTRH
jgi:hypothetical protein